MGRLKTSSLFVLLLFLSIFLMALRVPVDTDMWWHLAAGRYSPALRPLKFDFFSHTVEGTPWLNHSWLSQQFFYGLYRVGGLQAIALATAFLVTLSFAIIYSGQGNPYVKGFSLLMAALASSVVWTPRPHLFSFLAFAFIIKRLEGLRRRTDIILLPFVFMLWANLHGGYAAGLLVVLLSLAGNLGDSLLYKDPEAKRKAKLLALILPLTLLAVCFNPWGFELLLYPVKTLRIKTLQAYIQEWASPDFHLLANHPGIWLTIAIMLVLAFSRIRVKWADLLPLLGFFYLYLLAVRNIAFYSLLAGLTLMRYGEVALQRFDFLRPSNKRSHLNTLILILALVVASFRSYHVLKEQSIRAQERSRLPRNAVEFSLKEGLKGNLFNSYNWGGYLIWHLYPNCKVFVDGRTDLYGEGVLRDFLRVARAEEGWERILEKYKVKIVIVEREIPVVRCLELQKGWRKVYEDSLAVIFVGGESLSQ